MRCQYAGTNLYDQVGLDNTECNCSICRHKFVFKSKAIYLGHKIAEGIRIDLFELIEPPECPKCGNPIVTFAVMCANQGFDLFEKRKLSA